MLENGIHSGMRGGVKKSLAIAVCAISNRFWSSGLLELAASAIKRVHTESRTGRKPRLASAYMIFSEVRNLISAAAASLFWLVLVMLKAWAPAHPLWMEPERPTG